MSIERKCGSCRECCIVLEVDAVRKPADTPCKHLCKSGCGIYERRPASCREFTCAWREGQLGYRDQPSQTHMVIWVTNLRSPSGEQTNVIQCNVRQGAKRHKKTMRWLRRASYSMPVCIIQGDRCELISRGKSIVRWRDSDFVNLQYDNGGRIISGRVIPEAEVLSSPDKVAEWERINRSNLEVEETDPMWRREQLLYLEEKQ